MIISVGHGFEKLPVSKTSSDDACILLGYLKQTHEICPLFKLRIRAAWPNN
jgi:hypothetical protein